MNELPYDPPIPLYYRLSSLLKGQIIDGRWATGDKLPTETQLAEQYTVSRLTVRRAKAKLEEEGLIVTIQGSGSRVSDNLEWRLRKEPLSTVEDIVQKGQDTSFDLQEFHMVANTQRIAEHLQNPNDQFIFKICGVRYWMKQPLSYTFYHLPYTFGVRIQVDRLTEKPLSLSSRKCSDVKSSRENKQFTRVESTGRQRIDYIFERERWFCPWTPYTSTMNLFLFTIPKALIGQVINIK